jgi:hypothetical protein
MKITAGKALFFRRLLFELQSQIQQLQAAGVSVAPFGQNNPKFSRHFKANFIIGNVGVRILSGQPGS